MSFKKTLKNKSLTGQAVVEYIALFLVLVAGAIAVFGGFSPETLKNEIKAPFNNAVIRAIAKINEDR